MHDKINDSEVPLKFDQELSQFMKKTAGIFADVFVFENDGLKTIGVKLEVNSRLIEEVVRENKYLTVADVDDHLDNPANDFLNNEFA